MSVFYLWVSVVPIGHEGYGIVGFFVHAVVVAMPEFILQVLAVISLIHCAGWVHRFPRKSEKVRESLNCDQKSSIRARRTAIKEYVPPEFHYQYALYALSKNPFLKNVNFTKCWMHGNQRICPSGMFRYQFELYALS